jgi:hypothetical protein
MQVTTIPLFSKRRYDNDSFGDGDASVVFTEVMAGTSIPAPTTLILICSATLPSMSKVIILSTHD